MNESVIPSHREATASPPRPAAAMAEPPLRRKKPSRELVRALPWLVPTLLLIFGVVLYPAGLMIYNSFRKFSRIGVDRGPAGLDNYLGPGGAFTFPGVPIERILINTVVWVAVVVLVTLVLSIGLA